jgi:CBS domain containing-hemolysin-like protein
MHYETVAGFLIYSMKRIPKRAEHLTFSGFKFEVVDVEGIRVEQLLVSRVINPQNDNPL